MEKISIESVYFNKLKGLHDIEIHFSKQLTAIMGVNGSGKTTVIHALACIYKPDGNGENHKFPEFFVPNTDSFWNGSLFNVVNIVDNKVLPSRQYSKRIDRWNPRYDDRPKRNVYYLGIDSCLPEIEKNNVTSRIVYSSTNLNDEHSKKVLTISSRILNKDYVSIIDNEFHKKHLLGVKTTSGLKYSSLSMGTGEQRTIKIIDKALRAEPFSLLLIDEIDLLLHVSALSKLIFELHCIARKRNLQVVFTTHSLEMLNLDKYVSIQYIDVLNKEDGSTNLYIYDKPNSDIIRGLTGKPNRPISVYVEDVFSAAIIKTIVRKLKLSNKVSISQFGAAVNAFTIISGQCIVGNNIENSIAVLDGDVFKSLEEKEKQIKKVFTGTEENAEELRNQAILHILQYNLPDDTTPEKHMYDLLIKCDPDNEIVQSALQIHAVDDKHKYITSICNELDENINTLVDRIVQLIGETEEWNAYISPIEKWLSERIDI